LGAINPHRERFPTSVEAAVFAMLLLPWEDRVALSDVDWRGFNIPWTYTFDDDAASRRFPLPSSDTLAWEPSFYADESGEKIEAVRPMRRYLDTSVFDLSAWLNDKTLPLLMRARTSVLFETPTIHFLVRAFVSSGVDELLAHVTVIEAALGLRDDYDGRLRPKGLRTATDCMAMRVKTLLNSKDDGDAYRNLFDIRSQFLHGCTMNLISSQNRLVARRLARKVANGLVEAALVEPPPSSRADYLRTLIVQGMT
jgi:hypothetical protein